MRLAGPAQWIVAATCLAPVVIGFLVPLGYLAWQAAVRGFAAGFDTELIRHTLSTVLIASAACIVTLVLGFGAAAAVRLLRHPAAGTCMAIAGLGYAVPGTVLALGLLSPLVGLDDMLNGVARALTGAGIGLVVAGSSAAVVLAYVIRFLAIPSGLAASGLGRISPDLDDAARMSGARPGRVVRSIHLPLARSALWGAALLVFVDCLKELPATLLLRPLNVETLATYLYQYATRGSFEDGAPAALLIVVAGILPVMRMARLADAAVARPAVSPARLAKPRPHFP
jgi:iron(III) transport system permease protein